MRDSAKVKIGMRKAAKGQGWRKEFVAEGQRQDRRQRAREGWPRRIQNMLELRQGRTHCSLV